MPFIHLLFVLVITKVISIENCIEEKEGKCVKCDDHYVLEKDKCNQCDDLNCLHCFNSKPKNCYICSHEFTITQRQCGRKCDNIEQCDICNEDYTKCLHCMHGCQVDINGECSCKSRVIVIIVCIIISVIIIIVVFVCLSKGNILRQYKLVRLALNINEGITELHEEDDTNIELQNNNSNKLQYDARESHENLTSESSEKMICDYCLLEVGVIRLNCGCYLCKAHRSLIDNNEKRSCPVCKKSIDKISMVKCEMCNKNEEGELKKTKCGCVLSICNECLSKVNESKVECPSCHMK